MTRDEGVQLIKDQLAFRQTLDVEIVRQMKFAQTTLEKMPNKPWFLVSEDSYVNTTVGEQRVPLPNDFLEETEDAVLRRVMGSPDSSITGRALEKDDYDVLRKNYVNEADGELLSGPPEAYALLGQYFRLFPVPDKVYLVRQIYYKKDLTLDTNVENQWLKYVPMLMLGTAGMLIAKGPIRDAIANSVFQEWVVTDTALLNVQNEARMHANRRYQIGGPHN